MMLFATPESLLWGRDIAMNKKYYVGGWHFLKKKSSKIKSIVRMKVKLL